MQIKIDSIKVDILRNACGQTATAPFSVCPKGKASIAIPLKCEELDDSTITSN
ncbi:MAG: hypothetical protein PV345_02170 [Wolbachia sp.]|nr:hypothetical protein [Wolbachia sp.]